MNCYLFAENLPSRIQKVDASDYVLPEYDERVRQRRIEVYTASLQAYISFVENWVELEGNTPETREEIYRQATILMLLIGDKHYASDEMRSITHVTAGVAKEGGNEEETPAGSILNHYEYDAWGNPTVCEETVENRFRFNGQQYDPVAQQYYLRARFYNPVIARFTQEDTYRGDGLNLYAYCRNNPVYYVDPSGHFCEKAAERICGLIDEGRADGGTGGSESRPSDAVDGRICQYSKRKR